MGKPVNKTLRIAAMSAGEEIGHVSGPVVTFRGNGDPLRSLVANIDPVQDLNGYDNPWPAGGGKNLFDKDSVTMGKFLDTETGQPTNASSVYCVSDYIPVKNGVTVFILASTSARRWFYDSEKTPTTYLNNPNNQVFTPTEDGYIRVTIKTDVVSLDTYQIEVGTAASTYAPYSNICPISGWSAVNVWRTGKNLFDVNSYPLTSSTYIAPGSGAYYELEGDAATIDFVPCEHLAGKTITLNHRPRGFGVGFAFYTDAIVSAWIAGIRNDGATEGTPWTITVPLSAKYMRFTVSDADKGEIQLELGSTATAYEPYSGNQYTIQLGQTVYGGTLDVISGNLRVLYEKLTVNGSANWKTERNYFYYTSGVYSPPAYQLTPQVVCNLYPVVPITGTETITGAYLTAGSGETSGYLRVRDLSLTLDQFKTMLNETPIEYVHPLLTPITIPLTPQEISTLQGQNNVWADSGDVDVEYIATGGEGGKLALLLRNRKELLIALRKGLSPAEAGLLNSTPLLGGFVRPGLGGFARPGLSTDDEKEEDELI